MTILHGYQVREGKILLFRIYELQLLGLFRDSVMSKSLTLKRQFIIFIKFWKVQFRSVV